MPNTDHGADLVSPAGCVVQRRRNRSFFRSTHHGFANCTARGDAGREDAGQMPKRPVLAEILVGTIKYFAKDYGGPEPGAALQGRANHCLVLLNRDAPARQCASPRKPPRRSNRAPPPFTVATWHTWQPPVVGDAALLRKFA